MRQWETDPKLMCNKHLVGEHVEMHMFVGSINKGIDVTGYIKSGLLDIEKLPARHELIVEEMLLRGMHHKSPLPQLNSNMLTKYELIPVKINVQENLNDLSNRCELCRARITASS